MYTAELGAQYGQVSQYDKRGRMTNRYSINLSGYTVLADQWQYDPAGNVKHAIDSAQGNFAYTYDNLNRVTNAVIPPFTEGYSYDPWGNQTEHTLTAGTGFDWHYLPTTNNQASTQTARYDAAGNMVADGQHNYTYDAESRVATVDNGVQYKYDPEGMRVAAVSGGAVTAEYLYDMSSALVTTVNSAGAMVRTVLRAEGTHWGDSIGAAGAGGVRTEFRLVNQVGTLVANGDSQGNFIEGCLAGPFGDGQLCTPTYDFTETHFADKLRDAETDNDYFGARYFNSVMGRFLSPDWSAKAEPVPYAKLDNPQSLNLYAYAENNPLSHMDPDGHKDCEGQDSACMNDETETVGKGSVPQRQQQGQQQGQQQTPLQAAGSAINNFMSAGSDFLNDHPLVAIALTFGADLPAWEQEGPAIEEEMQTLGSEFVNLADSKATTHILEGDATGGGHAPGLGVSGKGEFPSSWSNDRIMHEISDVATSPSSTMRNQGNTRLIQGTRSGINIQVVIRDGRVVTGYPTNTPKNP